MQSAHKPVFSSVCVTNFLSVLPHTLQQFITAFHSQDMFRLYILQLNGRPVKS